MFRTDPYNGQYWDGGPPFGSSSFGYSPGSGEFGADPGALSQTTKEQWEMVPGHRDWFAEADAERIRRRTLVATTDPNFTFSRFAGTVIPPGYDLKRSFYLYGVKFDHYENKDGTPLDIIATVMPPAQPAQPTPPMQPTPPTPPTESVGDRSPVLRFYAEAAAHAGAKPVPRPQPSGASLGDTNRLPTPPNAPPQLGSPTMPFNPQANSPFASWLLYGKDTPIRDFLTNDTHLKYAEYTFAGRAIASN